MKKLGKREICLTLTLVSGGLLAAYELFGRKIFADQITDGTARGLFDMALTRAVASVAFLAILVYLGYRVMNPFRKPFGKALLYALPAIIVVINNLPIYPLLAGLARVTASPQMIWLLALESLMIGLFEESCFRGVVLMGFMEKRRASVKGRFWSIILTAAVFGAIHLVNLFLGSSPAAVLMQIGYSFLIGAMCSVVLLKSGNLWLCVLLHAVFDFCGNLVPVCGEGTIWEPVTVTLTAVIGVLATIALTRIFFKIKPEEVDRLYMKEEKEE